MTTTSITLADIEASIKGEYHFTAQAGIAGTDPHLAQYSDSALDQLTFCVLVLKNGFKVVGVNHGSADPANFDAELARKYARENAIEKLWEPMGYALKQSLHEQAEANEGRCKHAWVWSDFSNAEICAKCCVLRGGSYVGGDQ